MNASAHSDGVSDDWVREFPINPFEDPPHGEQWFLLYDVVCNRPAAAIRLFERFSNDKAAQSGKPASVASLRMFLAVHGDEYQHELEVLSRSSHWFAEAYARARDLGPVQAESGFWFFKRRRS